MALIVLAFWPLVAWVAAKALIVRADLAHADALVVLAGSAAYVERTHRAAQLFHQGRAPRIILTNDVLPSGWSSTLQRNPPFVERAAGELRRAGVPPGRIEVQKKVVSGTYEEAVRLREYASAHDMRSLLVVTSGYHSRRALWTLRLVFQDSGIEVGLDPVAPRQRELSPTTWWWHPQGWHQVAAEYPKLFYYHLRYR